MYLDADGPAHPDDQVGYVGTFEQLDPFIRDGSEKRVVDVYVIPSKDWGDNVVLRYGTEHMYDSMTLELLFSTPQQYPHFYATAREYLCHKGKLSWTARANSESSDN